MSPLAQLIVALALVGIAAAYLARRAIRRIKSFLEPGEETAPCDGCPAGCAWKPIRGLEEGCGGRGGEPNAMAAAAGAGAGAGRARPVFGDCRGTGRRSSIDSPGASREH